MFQVKSFANIALALHCPFPSSEIFRSLPKRDEILDSLLSCDVCVGKRVRWAHVRSLCFHTYAYARHFVTAVMRLLGYDLKAVRGGLLEVIQRWRSASSCGSGHQRYTYNVHPVEARRRGHLVHHAAGGGQCRRHQCAPAGVSGEAVRLEPLSP